MARTRLTLFVVSTAISSAIAQNIIQISSPPVTLSATLGRPITSVATIGISGGSPGAGPAAVKFKYAGVTPVNPLRPTPPNFVVVSPSGGTTSTDNTAIDILNPPGVLIGLNEGIIRTMSAGIYGLTVMFSTVDQSPPSQASVVVFLQLSGPPPPVITSVVNNASHQAAISPGTIVSIFGSDLGPDIGPTQYDHQGAYPTGLVEGDVNLYGQTTVTFSGTAAPLLYVSPGQINAIVPYGLASLKTGDVVLTRYGRSTAAFTVPILETSPGIFTARQNGIGGPILNAGPVTNSFTVNSESNPARKGSAISLFATGVGPWDPPVPESAISLTASALTVPPAVRLCGYVLSCRRPVAPISLTIGGKPAPVFYAGTTPYQPWSVLQVNARVPVDVDSGPQPIVLTVGQNDSSQQNVTIAIQ